MLTVHFSLCGTLEAGAAAMNLLRCLVSKCTKAHFLYDTHNHSTDYNTVNLLALTQAPAKKRPYDDSKNHFAITQRELMIQTRLSLGTYNISFTVPVAI